MDDDTWTQTDKIYRVSLLKPLAYDSEKGLLLHLVLHNDFCTRVSAENVTVDVAWTYRTDQVKYNTIHNKHRFLDIKVNEYSGCQLLVPFTQTNLGTRTKPNHVPPFKTLVVSISPNSLSTLNQLWPKSTHPSPFILPIRIELEQDFATSNIVFRTIHWQHHDNSLATIEFTEPPFNHTSSPLGSYVWDAGLVLAAYLATKYTKSQQLPLPKTIIELGAGNGFLGKSLIAVLGSSTRLILTDLEPLVPYMQQNMNRPPNVQCLPYTWGTEWPLKGLSGSGLLVIGSDIIYNTCTYPDLVSTLVQFQALWPQCTFVFAFKRRSLSDERAFLQLVVDRVVQPHKSPMWDMRCLGVTAGEVYVVQVGPI